MQELDEAMKANKLIFYYTNEVFLSQNLEKCNKIESVAQINKQVTNHLIALSTDNQCSIQGKETI